MSRRVVLWFGFVAVHVLLAVLGFVIPSSMGDVTGVYDQWTRFSLAGAGVVGIASGWVYPQLALLPMLLAEAASLPFGDWFWAYTLGWVIMATAVDAVAFGLLIGTGRSASRRRAAWTWLVLAALLGPVLLYRLESVTVALAVIGSVWLMGRPWLGSVLLAVATWMKVWPAAILAAALVVVPRRAAVLGGAAAVSILTVAVVLALGGAAHVAGFITDQADRGLQVEAPVSAYYLWRSVFELPGSFVYWDRGILTFQVTGPDVDAVIAFMTPLLVVAVLGVWVLGIVQHLRGASFATLFVPLSLALVLAFIVCNKVGSPQYIAWLIPSFAVGMLLSGAAWIRPTVLAGVIALLTQLVYPWWYDGVTASEGIAVSVLTVRNLLLVVLFVWVVVRLCRVPVGRRTPAVRPFVTA